MRPVSRRCLIWQHDMSSKRATPLRPKPASKSWRSVFVCLGLAGLVLAVFGQAGGFPFINLDDEDYVYGNVTITAGLNWQSVPWAMTHVVSCNWHPLTVLVHMLNCTFFGTSPGGHHLVSVAVHAATAVLLFLLLKDATARFWPCAWIAAIFAIHPLRVESVAWISELKDVLSGLFFVLTLWAYVGYARRPFSFFRYAAVGLCFALGLMCKPMLVTVPFVLLLLDYWPLQRLLPGASGHASLRHLVLEKLPLFALAAAASFGTLAAQAQAVISLQTLSLPLRVENALFSYAIYLRQTLVPIDLSPFYTYPESVVPVLETALLLLLLGGLTGLAAVWRRPRPWLTVGWLWFLGMLVPVLGVVQVGDQAHADRYMYLPQIGLLLLVAFSACEIGKGGLRSLQLLGRAAAVISVAACAILGWSQTRHWRNSEALWTHALRCNPRNVRAHLQLGSAFVAAKKSTEAAAEFRRALELQPSAEAHNDLATVLRWSGRPKEAQRHYRLAIGFEPRQRLSYVCYGELLASQGDLDGAIAVYRRALAVEPKDAEIRCNLGSALSAQQRFGEALEEFKGALSLAPDHFRALSGLCKTLARMGREEQAIPYLESACVLNGRDRLRLLCMLAEVYARSGKQPEALATARNALDGAELTANQAQIGHVRAWFKAFMAAQPR